MPIVYKLINPLNDLPYYVGFTEKSLNERFVGHLLRPVQKTTIALLDIDLLPLIEIITEGDTINKDSEMFWIKEMSKTYKLENIDGVFNYQYRKSLFDLPEDVINGIKLTKDEKNRIAINLLRKEMPLSSSVPIMIRINNILNWATNSKKAVNGY